MLPDSLALPFRNFSIGIVARLGLLKGSLDSEIRDLPVLERGAESLKWEVINRRRVLYIYVVESMASADWID
jgi:hypothetical protein